MPAPLIQNSLTISSADVMDTVVFNFWDASPAPNNRQEGLFIAYVNGNIHLSESAFAELNQYLDSDVQPTSQAMQRAREFNADVFGERV